jgi:hypothetical protein
MLGHNPSKPGTHQGDHVVVVNTPFGDYKHQTSMYVSSSKQYNAMYTTADSA